MSNALNWFEIPVTDLNRAKQFYGAVLDAELQDASMDGFNLAMLPHTDGGVGGALVVGDDYTPSDKGPIIYLNAGDNLEAPLKRIEAAGGKVVMPKTQISEEIGYIAMFIDSEGNRMALHSPH